MAKQAYFLKTKRKIHFREAAKKRYFLSVFKKAKAKYGLDERRLAAEDWKEHWQTLIATIMSAQSRDTTTIPIAEALFKKYPTLGNLSRAKYNDVLHIFKRLNYNKTKAKHVIAAAKFIISNFKGKLPEKMEQLVRIPGVGRKTANIVLVEVFDKEALPIDTHCHRIANVLGFVKTKTPEQTERALMKLAPKKQWKKINRIFVLWGKEVPGRDKKTLLKSIGLKS
jgi:endonuclease-3